MNGFGHANDKAACVPPSKVFAVESVSVNASANDVLATNHSQYYTRPPHKMHNASEASTGSFGHATNGNGNGFHAAPIARLQPLSSSYDRYPKPGSYGVLQVYPMNGINSEINNAKEHERSTNAPLPRRTSDELTHTEQERLDEILRMCADFERQNQSVQSSPIVQNRIKTNGSLPRDKKSPLGPNDSLLGSPNVFFPASPSIDGRKPLAGQSPAHPAHANGHGHGYENMRISAARQLDQSRADEPHRHGGAAAYLANGGQSTNGYENCSPVKRSPVGYVPQSPRTRIKTCISPKRDVTSTPLHHQRKAEYELLVQSFEDKLRLEIQQLRDIRSDECEQNHRAHRVHTPSRLAEQPPRLNGSANGDVCDRVGANQSTSSIGGPESIYGSLTPKSRATKTSGDDRSLIQRSLDEKQVVQLRKQHVEVLRKTRELKSQISELQRQEEEVLREVCTLCLCIPVAFVRPAPPVMCAQK